MFLQVNHQGSIIAASDDGGFVDYINTCDDYGVPSNLNNEGRFGYTGPIWLPEIGLYH